MEEELNQAIKVRSKWRSQYLKSKFEMENLVMTRKETTLLSYCVLKQKYYESLDIDKITDNKTFCFKNTHC